MRHEQFNLPCQRSVDELLHHWPTVCRLAEDDWAKGFALSIARQSRRRGWHPSAKQTGIMQRMVSELFTQADTELDLFED